MTDANRSVALVTGSAGFIGFHLCRKLLNAGWTVEGLDSLDDYYDVNLKQQRHALLGEYPRFTTTIGSLEKPGLVNELLERTRPEVIVHLAAQAGVRESIRSPRKYIDSNIRGTFELLEAVRSQRPSHLLIASTSSVFGADPDLPFNEAQSANHQVSFYAATKKATEAMSHSYAHLYALPTTVFRFFTVYGPWGRPDMALFTFVKSILDGQPIDLFNNGRMQRDFTYVDDIVEGIRRLINATPGSRPVSEHDSLSPAAPWRVVNIGNGSPVSLLDFVSAIETALGRSAKVRMLPMQSGDMKNTWADVTLLEELVGPVPRTSIRDGVQRFVDWYQSYYQEAVGTRPSQATRAVQAVEDLIGPT